MEANVSQIIEYIKKNYSDLERENFSKTSIENCSDLKNVLFLKQISISELQTIITIAKRHYDQGDYNKCL